MQIIILSIPIFVVLLVWEIWFAKIRRLSFFRFNDTIENLSCGLLSELFGLLYKGAVAFLYIVVYDRFRLSTPTFNSPAMWAYAIVLVDFLYYVVHRSSHRVNILWAGHIVHHQSEEYNLSVALRQSSLHGMFHWIFYLVAALLGLPFSVFITSYALNLLYQFWIHTRFIKTMGPIEWIFNTPSHHRIHHGRDEYCLDKNYAGILIIWDRMLGTYQEERRPPRFGITSRYRHFNPVIANIQYFYELGRRSFRMEKWWDRIYVWFAPPEWVSASERAQVVVDYEALANSPKYDPALPDKERRRIRLGFVGLVIVSFFILKFSTSLYFVAKLGAVAVVATVLVLMGKVLERKLKVFA